MTTWIKDGVTITASGSTISVGETSTTLDVNEFVEIPTTNAVYTFTYGEDENFSYTTRLFETYYVSPTGSDANDGSFASPFKSIWKAHQTATAGDTIYFRAGTYYFNDGYVGYDDFCWRMFNDVNRRGKFYSMSNLASTGEIKYVTYSAYSNEVVNWYGGKCYTWTYDDINHWWTMVLPQDTEVSNNIWNYDTNVIVENGWVATPIYFSVTCTANDASPNPTSDNTSALPGTARFEKRAALKSSYYGSRGNDTGGINWYLYPINEEWRITKSDQLTPDPDPNIHLTTEQQLSNVVNYWYSATLEGTYQLHGTYTGTPSIADLDKIDGIHQSLPVGFTDPSSILQSGNPILLNGGKLLYDLVYYDWENATLYFKSNEMPGYEITNPNTVGTRCYAVSDYADVCNADNPDYIIFYGINFAYGKVVVNLGYYASDTHITHGIRYQIKNCTIKHAWRGGLSGGGDHAVIDGNVIDYCSGAVGYRNDWNEYVSTGNSLEHAMYFKGNNCIISNNFVGRSRGGVSGHFYPWTQIHDTQIYNNVFYGLNVALLLDITGAVVTNNICISGPETWRGVTTPGGIGIHPYFGASDLVINNNYCESAYPIANYYQASNLTITNNVLKSTAGNVFYFDAPATTISVINNNHYIYNEGSTFVAKYPNSSHTLTTTANDFATFHSYFTDLGQEANSFASTSTQSLDMVVTEEYLNTNPDINSLMTYFRDYATIAHATWLQGSGQSITNWVFNLNYFETDGKTLADVSNCSILATDVVFHANFIAIPSCITLDNEYIS